MRLLPDPARHAEPAIAPRDQIGSLAGFGPFGGGYATACILDRLFGSPTGQVYHQ